MLANEVAQTNLQLMQQMQDLGYASSDRVMVADAYDFVSTLFSGRYRQDGRPFVAHLVGTAGVLVRLKAAPAMIVAALLHAIFQDGDFGDGVFGMTERRRDTVRSRFGNDVERLLVAYTESSRTSDALLDSYASFGELGETDRAILLIQLANEFDEYRDCAPLYSANAEFRLGNIRRSGTAQAEMARGLGFPELADALTEVYATALRASVPDELRSSHSWAYTLLPLSSRKRPVLHAREILQKVIRRLIPVRT